MDKWTVARKNHVRQFRTSNPMPRRMTGTIKPNHKALAAYYETLRAYGEQQVTHEGALETATRRTVQKCRSARKN